jgi:TRAP transporter 4TM/12TM fusion protein
MNFEIARALGGDLVELSENDAETAYRVPDGWWGFLIAFGVMGMACLHIYVSFFGFPFPYATMLAVDLAFVPFFVFLLYPCSPKLAQDRFFLLCDVFLALIGVIIILCLLVELQRIMQDSKRADDFSYIIGFMSILFLLEATRRVSNIVLPIVTVLSLAYCYFGRSMPGAFAHRGYSFFRIIDHLCFTSEGIFGTPLRASVTIFTFILLGAILEESGLRGFVTDLSFICVRGDSAEAAVLSSGIMVGLTGVPLVNTSISGKSSIFLMKNAGYTSHFAAAVMAVSSAAGQFVPPILGMIGYLMAEMLGVRYTSMLSAAILPMVVFYLAIFLQVHFEAAYYRSTRVPDIVSLFKKKGILLVPVIILACLLSVGYIPGRAAFWGIVAALVSSFLNKETRLTPIQLLHALSTGVQRSISVICICACASIIWGVISKTGASLMINSLVTNLSNKNLLLTLLVAMCMSLFFGAVRLPVLANFMVTSGLMGSTLISCGSSPIAAYMAVFYFSAASELILPSSKLVRMSAKLAEADPKKTDITALKLAATAFLIPFIFVFIRL